jgi:hypothetical protein
MIFFIIWFATKATYLELELEILELDVKLQV